jgi:hypothetical protein
MEEPINILTVYGPSKGERTHVTNLTSFRIRATRKMRSIFTTRITLAVLFVVETAFSSATHACITGIILIMVPCRLCSVHAAANQVKMEVHIGPRNARHTVEPEAGYGGEISLQRHKEIVLVCHVLVVITNKKLEEGLNLTI